MLRMSLIRKLAAVAGLGLAGAAGLVAAQPSPPGAATPQLAPVAPPAPVPGAASGPVIEEAPPQETPTPVPIVVPPITEKEIAPAPQTPAAEQKPAAPVRRARYDVAVLEALDKVTAQSMVFAAPVGKPIRYKGLIITVRACERSTPDEPVEDSIAYLTIESQPRAEPGMPAQPSRQVFKGWMYAASPGLNPAGAPGLRRLGDQLQGGVAAGRRRPLEVRGRGERALQPPVILPPGDLLRPELRQVLGQELRVQQGEAAADQPRRQVDQGDLRGVGLAAEHALAEEGAGERHAVEAAHQPPLAPALDGVRMTLRMEFGVQLLDGVVDPGLAAVQRGLGAKRDDRAEGGVDADLEVVLTHGARQAPGHVEAIERHHAPVLRIDQEDPLVLARVGHGEDPAGVAGQQLPGAEVVHVPVGSRRRHLPARRLKVAPDGSKR
jgi:hypothetical protein